MCVHDVGKGVKDRDRSKTGGLSALVSLIRITIIVLLLRRLGRWVQCSCSCNVAMAFRSFGCQGFLCE